MSILHKDYGGGGLRWASDKGTGLHLLKKKKKKKKTIV